MTAPARRPESRRSLTHVGGRVDIVGDPALGQALGQALAVQSSVGDAGGEGDGELAARAHVHGFHTYPARLHPDTAARLVASLSRPRDVVFDPFCGSGTVVVEAALAGRRAAGSDVNPLAVKLAELKTRPSTDEDRGSLVAAAHRAGEVAKARRKARSGPSRRYPPPDVDMFDSHVLLELDSIRVGIDEEPDPRRRSELYLVLSAILVKVSRRASDTAQGTPRRLAAGYPTRLFTKKAEELAERLGVVADRLRDAPRAKLFLDDARVLSRIPDRATDLVVTSPPYPGVYDYLDHHAARLRWLGLSAQSMEKGEIGARRALRHRSADDGRAAWADDLGRVFSALARVLKPKGKVVLIMADAVIGGRGVFCGDLIPELAARTGFEVVAVASQERPHFHLPTLAAFASRPRREHAMLLSPSRVWEDSGGSHGTGGRSARSGRKRRT